MEAGASDDSGLRRHRWDRVIVVVDTSTTRPLRSSIRASSCSACANSATGSPTAPFPLSSRAPSTRSRCRPPTRSAATSPRSPPRAPPSPSGTWRPCNAPPPAAAAEQTNRRKSAMSTLADRARALREQAAHRAAASSPHQTQANFRRPSSADTEQAQRRKEEHRRAEQERAQREQEQRQREECARHEEHQRQARQRDTGLER